MSEQPLKTYRGTFLTRQQIAFYYGMSVRTLSKLLKELTEKTGNNEFETQRLISPKNVNIIRSEFGEWE